MADNTVRFVGEFDDGQLERRMLAFADQLDKLQAEFDALSASGTTAFKDINQAAAKGEEEIKQYNKQLDEAADKTKKAEHETGRFGRGLKALFGNLSIGGVSLNDLSDGLQNVKSGLADVSASSRTAGNDAANLGKGFGVLRLGALGVVAAVGVALVAAFSRFSKNADELRSKFAGVKAGFLEVANVAGVYGTKILEVIKGNKGLRDALQEARKETKGWTDEVRKAAEVAEQLELRQIKLERQTNLFNATYKFQRGELEKLSIQAEKFNDLSANTKRQQLSQSLEKENIRLAEERLGILLNQNNATDKGIKNVRSIIEAVKSGRFVGDDEGLQKFVENIRGIREGTGAALTDQVLAAVEEYGDLTETIQEQQSEIQSQRQSIIAARKAAADQRAKEIADATKQLQDLVNATAEARAKLGDENDQIQLSYSNATAEVEKLKIEYTKLAKLIGTGETADDINALFEPLQRIADIDFEKASFGQSLEVVTTGLDRLLKIATDPLTGNISDLVSSQTAKPLAERLRADGLEAGKALGAAVAQGAKLEAERQREQGNELARQLIGSLAPDAINAFFEAEQAQFELRIARQDALIAKTQERLEVEKQALDEQQKLAEQGFANDVKGAEKRVREQERLLREGEARKIEIERRAAKQRAIIAAGQQAVELTLSVAKLISAEASKGLIGLVVALGGIAIISRIMAASRAQAASESGKTAAYATGTEYVEGAGTETSDSINARLSRGERVMTAKDNRKLGGRKLKNEDLVKYALIGQRFADTPLLDYALSMKGRAEQYEAMKLELQFDAMRTAYRDAAMAAADKQIEYWKSRPIEYLDSEGNTVREWSNGSGVVRQVITQNENISII